MPRVLLALDVPTEDRLLGDVIAAGHTVVARVTGSTEILAALEGKAVELAVVSAADRCLTRHVLEECDRCGVRMVALAANEAEQRNASAVGLHEVLESSAHWDDVERLVNGLPSTTASAAPTPGTHASDRRPGTVLTVWGPTGAPGRTTVAITLAAEIAAAGHSVVLADVDTYGGAIAPALGLLDEAPGFAAACRLAGSSSLTRSELMRIGQRYSSTTCAFWVLTGIGRPSRWPELSGDRVAKSIEACREWADYVVVDTGFSLENDEEISSDLFAPRRNAATNAALRAADHVIAVGAADPIGLARFLRAHVDLLELLDGQRVSVLINRVRPGVIGLNPGGQVAQTLLRFGGIQNPVLVPDDHPATDAALLSGSILRDVAPRSPALASIASFVHGDVLPPPPLPLRRRLRRGRMAPALG